LQGEDEDRALTLAEAAALTGVSEATLRHRLAQLAVRANGGPPPAASLGAELERIARSEVTAFRQSSQAGQQGIDLALDLVARLEAQAVEISRLSALASKGEALDHALAAEREERERLQGELREADSELQSLKSRLGGVQARQLMRGGLETELVRTQAELAAAKAQLADAQTSWRSVLSRKLKQRREQGGEDEDKRRDALSAELGEVREALETAQRRIAELEQSDAERVVLQDKLAAAQRDLANAEERIAELAQSGSRRGLSLVARRLGLGR
jgi:chromosome segregation ATPase